MSIDANTRVELFAIFFSCWLQHLRGHNIVRSLIHHKWNNFGERSTLKNVLYYFIFVFLTSFALITAGEHRIDGFQRTVDANNTTTVVLGDPRKYDDPLSYCRAVAEILVIVGTLASLYAEIRELMG